MKTAVCSKCEYEKPLSDFYKANRTPFVCVRCVKGKSPQASREPRLTDRASVEASNAKEAKRLAQSRELARMIAEELDAIWQRRMDDAAPDSCDPPFTPTASHALLAREYAAVVSQ